MRTFYNPNVLRSLVWALLLLAAIPSLHAQEWFWVRGVIPSAAMVGVSHDPGKNVYGLGRYRDTLQVEEIALERSRGEGGFLVSYTTAGTLRWGRTLGTASGEVPRGLTVDGYGNSFVVGDFWDTLRIGDTLLTSRGGSDIFVACYNIDGEFRWATQLGGTGDDHGTGCAVDIGSTVYVTGSFQGNMNFGATTVTALGSRDLLVASIRGNGAPLTVQTFGGVGGSAEGGAIYIRGNNEVYIAGTFRGPLTVAGTTLHSANNSPDGVAIRLYPSLVPAWGVAVGGSGVDSAFGVASAATRCVFVGAYTDTLRADTMTLGSRGGKDCFVAAVDTSGHIEWLRSFGSTLDDAARGVAVRGRNTYFLTGEFRGTLSYGDTTVVSAGGSDIFVAGVASNGALAWINRAGGSGDDVGRAVDADASDFDLAGEYRGSAQFGDTTLTGGIRNGYTARFAEPRTLTLQYPADSVCAGSRLDLPFEAGGDYSAADEFIAEISDVTGLFAVPQEVGRTIANSRLIEVMIPANLPPGTGYRLRVRSALTPMVSTDNGADLTVLPVPHPVVVQEGPTTFCAGGSVRLTAPEGYASYRWSTFETSRSITVTSGGDFWVVVPGENGCDGQSSPVTVTVFPPPIPPTITHDNNTLFASVDTNYRAYQWFLDGQEISGATGESYTIEGPGSYTVRVSDSNGCTSMSSPYAADISDVREDGEEVLQLVYANGAVRVLGLSGSGTASVIVMDDRGGCVREIVIPEAMREASFIISELPSGVYHFMVLHGRVRTTRSLIIVR